MDEKHALKLIEQVGGIRHGHFVYTSGKHGSVYIDKDRIYLNPVICSEFCWGLATMLSCHNITMVVAPEKGGIILSQFVALYLSRITHVNAQAAYAEKEGGHFLLRRGYDQEVAGKHVAVVEDTLHSGDSAAETIRVVREHGGDVVAVGAFWNRGRVTTAMLGNVPLLLSLVNKSLDSWNEADCPLCKSGVPINTEVGKGREFLARHASI